MIGEPSPYFTPGPALPERKSRPVSDGVRAVQVAMAKASLNGARGRSEQPARGEPKRTRKTLL